MRFRRGLDLDYSVIIPTFQRRDLVVSNVRALERQSYRGAFEVIVVVDGSSDNSAAALRNLTPDFPLTVIEQSNQGIAAARNKGAAAAKGEMLLFLDDDMEADPNLLAEHTRSHSAGADVVTGHVPLHPQSPCNFLSDSVKAWAEDRANALLSSPENPDFLEVVGGQLSISRELFFQLDGFDTAFTRNGTFGNEDRDLVCRILDRGHRIFFNPQAISWQTYVVIPRQFLRNYRQAGAADVYLARKHPERADRIFNPECVETNADKYIWRWLCTPLRCLVLSLLEHGHQSRRYERWFWWIWKLEYSCGVRAARRTSRLGNRDFRSYPRRRENEPNGTAYRG